MSDRHSSDSNTSGSSSPAGSHTPWNTLTPGAYGQRLTAPGLARLPPKLYLQMDNCVCENKNVAVLAYLSWLVQLTLPRLLLL
jgi:hypothetical protein